MARYAALAVLIILEIAEMFLFGTLFGRIIVFPLCVASALFGGYMIDTYGSKVMEIAAVTLDDRPLPRADMIDDISLCIAGCLLMIPGFITDLMGIALIFPMFRYALYPVIKDYLNKYD